MIDIKVEMKRNDFMWLESREATKKFFEIEKTYREIFSENNLKNILKFYTGDELISIYELKASIEKNKGSLTNKNAPDVKVTMFVEGGNGCHKLIFYLSDYMTKTKGNMAMKHAKQNLEYTFFKREIENKIIKKAV